jgi:hypothetical protein
MTRQDAVMLALAAVLVALAPAPPAATVDGHWLGTLAVYLVTGRGLR